jgi:hypothetical protein
MLVVVALAAIKGGCTMAWFWEKKVEVEITGSDGKPKRVKIPERQFNQWAAQGKIQRVDCQAHILGLVVPYRVETWIIGTDVTQETYDRLKDENGHLYVVEYLRDGKPERYAIAKPLWDKHQRNTLATPTPSTMEEHFDYYHKALLASNFEAQAVAATTINTLWRGFNAVYPDFESFRNADEAEKTDYLHKMGDMIRKMASDELMSKAPEGTSRGAAVVQLYLTAVATNNVTMINRIADALEPFNKMANDMLEATRNAQKSEGS